MHVTAFKAHSTEAALKMSCRKKGHEREERPAAKLCQPV
jgi:hypothetical protein